MVCQVLKECVIFQNITTINAITVVDIFKNITTINAITVANISTPQFNVFIKIMFEVCVRFQGTNENV